MEIHETPCKSIEVNAIHCLLNVFECVGDIVQKLIINKQTLANSTQIHISLQLFPKIRNRFNSLAHANTHQESAIIPRVTWESRNTEFFEQRHAPKTDTCRLNSIKSCLHVWNQIQSTCNGHRHFI